jgi:hypothetical protein
VAGGYRGAEARDDPPAGDPDDRELWSAPSATLLDVGYEPDTGDAAGVAGGLGFTFNC